MKPYRGIFVSDLDGTMLRQGRISVADVNAFAGLDALGVLRVIATGRSLHAVQNCLPDEFPVDYVILSTGCQVLDWRTKELVQSSSMDAPEVRDACALLWDMDLSFMIHDVYPDTQCFVTHTGSNPPADYTRRLALYAAHGRDLTACGYLGRASQFVAIVDAEDGMLFERIARELPRHSVIRATSPLDGQSVWIEIFAYNVSKSSGIRHILDHHDMDDALMAAIGNDHNDQDMLNLVHLPYRVHDAFIADKDRYITTPDIDGPVAFAISHFTKILHSGKDFA